MLTVVSMRGYMFRRSRDEDELVLDCTVNTGQSAVEIVFRAFVQGSDMNDHDAVCSDTALLYTISKLIS